MNIVYLFHPVSFPYTVNAEMMCLVVSRDWLCLFSDQDKAADDRLSEDREHLRVNVTEEHWLCLRHAEQKVWRWHCPPEVLPASTEWTTGHTQ